MLLLVLLIPLSCTQQSDKMVTVASSAPEIQASIEDDSPSFKKPEAESDSKIVVMVIDTGISPHFMIKPYLETGWETNTQDYLIDLTDTYYSSMIHHGTHIAGIILFGDQTSGVDPACGEVEIHSCKFYHNSTNDAATNLKDTVTCLKKALTLNADFINYSAGGLDPSESEKSAIQALSANGTKIVVAAGNESKSYEDQKYFPAGYYTDAMIENVIPVANIQHDGTLLKSSNFTGGIIFDYGKNIKSTVGTDQLGYMTGTSQAAAMYTHRLIMRRCKQIHIEAEQKKKLQEQAKPGNIR